MIEIKKEILNGTMPSEVFKMLLIENNSLTNSELATMFKESFPNVNGEALQVIWKWKGPINETGIDDEKLDNHLLYLLETNK